MIDRELAKELELDKFYIFLDKVEKHWLNLIYNPILDEVQERWVYEKTSSLIDWKCAICGDKMLIDKNRNDIENFVCENCKELYNNNNEIVDIRILKSRNELYKFLEDKIYEELEDRLKGRSK